MKKISGNKRIAILVFAVTAMILAYLLDYINLEKRTILFDVNDFQDELYQKQDDLNSILVKTAEWINQIGPDYFFIDKQKDILRELDDKGFSTLIYSGDSLIYWSHNYFDLNKTIDELSSNYPVFLGNTWFLPVKYTEESESYIGLIKLKQEFNYENKFLHNAFQVDFDIPENSKITIDEEDTNIHIMDRHADYLFSIVLPDQVKQASGSFSFSLLLYILGIILIIFFIEQLKISRNFKLFIYFIFFVLLRYILWKFRLPYGLFESELFSPVIYASSHLTPSLGDFLLHGIICFSIAISFYSLFTLKTDDVKASTKYVILVVIVLVLNLLTIELYRVIEDLVINSTVNFEVYRIQEITWFSITGFIIISLFIGSFLLFLLRTVEIVKRAFDFKDVALWYITITLFMFVIFRVFFMHFGILPIFILCILVLSIIYIQFNQKSGFIPNIFIVIIISLFSLSLITEESIDKERKERKMLIEDLAAEHDPIAELLLEDAEKKILTDVEIVEYLNKPEFDYDEFLDYIQKKYFVGFWNKYDLQITICTSSDSLIIQPDQQWAHCYEFFNTLVNQQGEKLSSSDFYFLDNQSGHITYFGYFIFPFDMDSEISLFLQLESKLIAEELGYPELLYDKETPVEHNLSDYSYAKYKYNKLISQNGSFLYSLNLGTYGEHKEQFSFFNQEGADHLLYEVNDKTSILMSKPIFTFYDGLISFSYLFVFFYIISLIATTVYNYRNNIIIESSFKTRIQYSMVGILLLSLLFIGGGTILFNVNQYQYRYYKSISEKIRSVQVELKHKLGYESYLDNEMRDYISSLLIKFSNVFYSDINLYDPDGNLYATSRPEIFERQLTGLKMNTMAFAELAVKKQVEFIHDEKIGELSFASGYVPFYNNRDELLAYLNLPYFSKQAELTEEISTFIVAIINIYVLLILITIVIAVFISGEITRPLRYIKEKFKGIDFGKKGEQITYKGNDEIASLVREYNRMVLELEEKAELLAKSERESAWREMAKQIAHEIKNPLTPMKLNVQLLDKLWMDKDEDFEERLKKITQSLIEQINSLSLIANEFSGFAKMPKEENEVLNIIKKLHDSITLFENSSSIHFKYDFHDTNEILVFADREQLLRVFNNLIKNSIQALHDVPDPEIFIDIKQEDGKVKVEFRDNGKGIPDNMKDKLFQPSFTTKTSGMGLGLAIVKNIVENIGGRIWFETIVNNGTSFFVELPVHKP